MFERLLLMAFMIGVAGAARGLEDPTRPPEKRAPASAVSVAAPRLTSILVGPDRRLAMINNRIMVEGERVGGVVLEKIDADAVVVRTGGRRMRLSLVSKNIVKEAK